MATQISYSIDGKNFATPPMDENSKKVYIQALTALGVEYSELPREDKKWHCPVMVFDLQKVKEAKKAFAEGKLIDGVMYTFGDPKEIVDGKGAYDVQCTNGRIRIAYAIGVLKWTANEIKVHKAKIGYEHLGLIVGKI